MFADACEKAMRFTRPVIISTRSINGKTASSCGAFIVLNREGWILTAGHVFLAAHKYQEDQKKIREIEKRISQGEKVEMDGTLLTNQSFWWGWDSVKFVDGYVDPDMDIAVGRLEGFRPDYIKEYPVFKDPDALRPGTSLCRIGFPFVDSATDFDEKEKRFCIRKGVLPMTFFPNDCIITRHVLQGKSMNGKYDKLYIETSTPGLLGQSGGPIYDNKGRVAALQVRTAHLPLGFFPKMTDEAGKTIFQPQFLNVGVGVHVKIITQILDDLHVSYNSEVNDQGFRIVG